MIFPTEEEWRDPALLLRRTYPAPEYLGAKLRRGKEKGRRSRGEAERREKKKEEEEKKNI